jgi:hypothetical protein
MGHAQQIQFGISTTVLREHPVSYSLEEIACVGDQAVEVWLWHLKHWDEKSASTPIKPVILALRSLCTPRPGYLTPSQSI